MQVLKFGGTSVADARAIGEVVGIVSRTEDRRFVVVSALAGVTNALVEAVGAAGAGDRDAALEIARALRVRHLDAAQAVRDPVRRSVTIRQIDRVLDGLDALLGALAVLREVTPRSRDAVLAAGELASSRLVAAALADTGMPVRWLDPRELVVTDDHHGSATPNHDETTRRLRARACPDLDAVSSSAVVTGGFVGATSAGVTTTLGRGGSDYSAAVIGACLGVREIQIWTDVDGILTADPSLVADARPVARLSAAEAAELAYFGAKVLHPATIAPAVAAGIPVRILNSRRPEAPGSLVLAGLPDRATPLAALACKRGITVIDITSNRMLMACGFLRRLFEVFERFDTPVDVVTTSEVSVSVTLDDRARLAGIVSALGEFAEVFEEPAMAILCLVGEGLRDDAALAGTVLGALDGVTVRMVSQAASRRNLTVVLRDVDLPSALARLHGRFFGREEAAAPVAGVPRGSIDAAEGAQEVPA